MSQSNELLRPREAAQALGISYVTLKQWIYAGKIKTTHTAGGHHRVPVRELERFLPPQEDTSAMESRKNFRRISGRNQLIGKVVELKIDRLLAQVKTFHRRPADYFHHHGGGGAGASPRAGRYRGGAGESDGSDDSAGMTRPMNVKTKDLHTKKLWQVGECAAQSRLSR